MQNIDETLLQTLQDENKKIEEEIQMKKELLKKLQELAKENEHLRLQSQNLDHDIEKTVNKMRTSSPVKTLHL